MTAAEQFVEIWVPVAQTADAAPAAEEAGQAEEAPAGEAEEAGQAEEAPAGEAEEAGQAEEAPAGEAEA